MATQKKSKAKIKSDIRLNNELIAVFRKASIPVSLKLELYQLLDMRKKANAMEAKLEKLNTEIEKRSAVLRMKFKV